MYYDIPYSLTNVDTGSVPRVFLSYAGKLTLVLIYDEENQEG